MVMRHGVRFVVFSVCFAGLVAACSSAGTTGVGPSGANGEGGGDDSSAPEGGEGPGSDGGAQSPDASIVEAPPGTPGAACTEAGDCFDKKCSPVTKTCDGCFVDGLPCGTSTECCSGKCDGENGTCGLAKPALGKCYTLVDCPPAPASLTRTCSGKPGYYIGLCNDDCSAAGSSCALSPAGHACIPLTGSPKIGDPALCGCRGAADCPSGKGCQSGTCDW